MRSEKDLLDSAKKYSFRGRVDKTVFAGPVFVRGEGSTVEDVNGKQYLDFNSGQMCSALGTQPPPLSRTLSKKSCDELIHAHSSFFNNQEIIPRRASRRAAARRRSRKRPLSPVPAQTPTRRR